MTSPTLTDNTCDISSSTGEVELLGVELGGAGLELAAFVGEDLEGVGLWIGLITCSSCLVSCLL